MFKKLLLALLGLAIVLPIAGSITGIKLNQFKAMGEAAAQMQMPPTPVNAIEVRTEVWQPRIATVGSVVAMQGTIVRTESEGMVREVAFTAGSSVKAGDILLQLDTDLEKAQMREAEASAESARITFKRAQELIQTRNISRDDYDAAESRVKQTAAQVDYFKAVIAKKTVRAPFSGQLGIRTVSIGQFLPKASPIVPLQSLDPIYVEFSLPQQQLANVTQGLKVAVTSDAYSGQEFIGTISAVNPDIDPSTRSFRVQATFKNSNPQLRPGMFVSINVMLDRTETLLLVPATAIQHGAYGDSVFIIEPDKSATGDTKPLIVRQQIVRLGQRLGDFTTVTEGLSEGMQIVSTGVFKMRPGMQVVIDNSLAPEFKLNPKPANS